MKATFVPGLIVLVTLAASCGTNSVAKSANPGVVSAGGALISQIMVDRTAALSYAAPPANILEALPGTDYSLTNPAIAAEALLLGSIRSVDPGQAYAVGQDGRDYKVVNGGDVQELVVTFDVDEVVCATVDIPATLTLGFWLNDASQVDAVADDMKQMGSIALFVAQSRTTKVPAFDEPQYALLSAVDDSGNVAWPAAKAIMGADWIKGGTSISTLRGACPV